MAQVIDLRSDTVTRPTAAMRRAMAEAEVGDDVFGDDPTVNALQEEAADLLGKEAALFVPSGTMANSVALGALAEPGDEVVCESDAHIVRFEEGALAANLRLSTRTIPGGNGILTEDHVRRILSNGNGSTSRTRVVALENTVHAAGGRVFPIDQARSIRKLCDQNGVAVHIDGARIFNAQVATGTPASEWAECADTVSFCFSKGLGAPIGSIVCSSREIIDKARGLRKRLGGGMRQVGVLAAAARVALETGVDRLAEDHANARRLAIGLHEMNPSCIDPSTVETNLVLFDIHAFGRSGQQLAEQLLPEGILINGMERPLLRLATHKDVSAEDIETVLTAFRRVLL